MHQYRKFSLAILLTSNITVADSNTTFTPMDYNGITPAVPTILIPSESKDATELTPVTSGASLPIKNNFSAKSKYIEFDSNREKFGIPNKDGTYGDGFTKQEVATERLNNKMVEINKDDTTILIRVDAYGVYNPDDEVLHFKIPATETKPGYFIKIEHGKLRESHYKAKNAFGFVGTVSELRQEFFGINITNLPKKLTHDKATGRFSYYINLKLPLTPSNAKSLKETPILLAITGNYTLPIIDESVEHYPAKVSNLESKYFTSKGISILAKKLNILSGKTGLILGEMQF